MNKINEKYLARMLEGAEQGLDQLDATVESINTQLEQMKEQREDMVLAQTELKKLLGLDEEATPELLVEEDSVEE
tara:strand:- start:213 stop:437 length:225 start_codon:yes stop_codon:yes gene_type:complete